MNLNRCLYTLAIIGILMAVFNLYLMPGFIINIANQLLTLCGF